MLLLLLPPLLLLLPFSGHDTTPLIQSNRE